MSPELCEPVDVAQRGRLGHARGDAQRRDHRARAARILDVEIEQHIPRRIAEAVRAQDRIALLAHAQQAAGEVAAIAWQGVHLGIGGFGQRDQLAQRIVEAATHAGCQR